MGGGLSAAYNWVANGNLGHSSGSTPGTESCSRRHATQERDQPTWPGKSCPGARPYIAGTGEEVQSYSLWSLRLLASFVTPAT